MIGVVAALFLYFGEPKGAMRQEPSRAARMETEVRYSEEVEIVEKLPDGWTQIKTVEDGCTGWIFQPTLIVKEERWPNGGVGARFVCRPFIHLYDVPDTEWGPRLTLPYGSALALKEAASTGNQRWLMVELLDGSIFYVQRGDVSERQLLTKEGMCDLAKIFLGLPYIWGGRSGFGYDCSGYVQMLYQKIGIQLPRNTKEQIQNLQLQEISEAELEPGDLIFWSRSSDLGNHQFIHASVSSMDGTPWIKIEDLRRDVWMCKTGPSQSRYYRKAKPPSEG